MPWTETNAMTERAKFVLRYEEGLFTMTELCSQFGISRPTGYKWLERYRAGGVEALGDRSRAPKHCPHRTPEAVARLIVKARRAHPTWGPVTLIDYLRPRHPDVALPAPSTVGDILKREGLVKAKRRRKPSFHPGARPLIASKPNEVWTSDFKGEFRLGSGAYCYPLTVQDAYSRYLLACNAQDTTAHMPTQEGFVVLFREHGLPAAIRTDNGVPFCQPNSRLGVFFITLGIRHERIQPGKPWQNGRHERMHRTLKAEATLPPEADFPAQQTRFDGFREEFNDMRPHRSLDGATPARHHRPSEREMPPKLPKPEYPPHFEVRLVSHGFIRFKGQLIFVSIPLAGEHLGLEEIDDGIWNLYFHHVILARVDERDFSLHPATP